MFLQLGISIGSIQRISAPFGRWDCNDGLPSPSASHRHAKPNIKFSVRFQRSILREIEILSLQNANR
ncbi:hypothetical protein AAHA92_29141 [Salvia divinorum]|uniref:Ycf15 n=1 Tax=Salvia divinorum TaxID=28513 RepID=A0ABD1FZX0_SALDI